MWWKYELYMKWNDYCDYNQSQIWSEKMWTTAVTITSHRHEMRNERVVWLSVTEMKKCGDEQGNLFVKKNDYCDYKSQKWNGGKASKMKCMSNEVTAVTISQMNKMKWKDTKRMRDVKWKCEKMKWRSENRKKESVCWSVFLSQGFLSKFFLGCFFFSFLWFS